MQPTAGAARTPFYPEFTTGQPVLQQGKRLATHPQYYVATLIANTERLVGLMAPTNHGIIWLRISGTAQRSTIILDKGLFAR